MSATAERDDPFLSFRFEIRFDGKTEGGFSECSGIQVETEVQEFAEGGLNTHLHKFVTRSKQSNITLKRGIVDDTLWQWHNELVQGLISYRNGTILVRDPSGGDVVMEWQFWRAFPSKFIGPELNAGQSSVAVETLELCHHGLERIK
ncbi:MAG: phage tail protein [Candidatus Promineifilaceae bacterium]|nr:phage tail protein [Candidatus Promineifilaceae bacterium]